jgi:hypothetical protein
MNLVRYDKVQALAMPSEIPVKIVENAATFSGYNRELTEQEVKVQSIYLDESLKDSATLASVLFDYQTELPFPEIQKEFLEARENGTLEENLPDLITRTKNIILAGYQDAALQSKIAYDERTAAATGTSITPKITIDAGTKGFNNSVPIISTTGGRSWIGVDANGKLPVGKDGRVDASKIAGYRRGKIDTKYGGWSFEDGVFIKKGDKTAWAAAN